METCYSWSGPLDLEAGKLLAVLPTLGKVWRLSFFINPTSFTYNGWTNIIHLTSGGNRGNSGDRTPAIFFHPDRGFSVHSDVNGNPNFKPEKFKPPPAPIGEWTLIVVSQMKKESEYIYRIVIGDSEYSVENTEPAEFSDVHVYASNPFGYVPQPGSIKRFEFCQAQAGKEQLVKLDKEPDLPRLS